MGQYFKCVCPSRKEYISLDSGMKVVERLSNTKAMTQLAFLLYDHDAPDEYYDYYGRWAGEEVRLVGDYADNDLYSAPDPTLEIAPLSNPGLIKKDMKSTTAPDPDAVTENWTVTLDYARIPVIKGSWNGRGRGKSIPSEGHPDRELTVGTYMEIKEDDDDRLDGNTMGVVMSIENDWTDVTGGVEDEFQVLVDSEEIEQDGTAILPRHVLES